MSAGIEFLQLCRLIPEGGGRIDWDAFAHTPLAPYLEAMAKTGQNPEYHAEGDVLTHTRMVCEAMVASEQYARCDEEGRQILFLGALLHDVGKPRTTKLVDGTLTSPYHSSVGAVLAREILWRDFSLSGDERLRRIRESVCMLVRYHSFPPYAIETKNAEVRILSIAANGQLACGFSMDRLCLIERADTEGKICRDKADSFDRIEYCRSLAEELGCLTAPYTFSSDYTRRAYFRGQTAYRADELYNDTWGEVILMSGLPGTGKDTWISTNCKGYPVISLDAIRAEIGVSPTENQAPVIALAHERARALLRDRTPFVWNATSITKDLRSKQISLFEKYGAAVRTVFLETEWNENLRRNKDRSASVPEAVISKMLSRLELPEIHECQRVDWLIV